jgi:hypothetical protein
VSRCNLLLQLCIRRARIHNPAQSISQATMKLPTSIRAATALAVCFLLGATSVQAQSPPAPRIDPPYDPDPQHLWNRLHDALFVRTTPDGREYGRTELDILFWSTTRHLQSSPSREKAIQVLDQFIRTRGERLVRDPVKRALLQRDLWELFDWNAKGSVQPPSATPELNARAQLQRRLVTIIQRIALSADEMRHLPDTYAQAGARLEDPAFPHELFVSDGPWVLLGRVDELTAFEHTVSFGGRSVFLVFASVPGGRERTLAYLEELRNFSPALVYVKESFPDSPPHRLITNSQTPQFPAGTRWALVRRLNLIDNLGRIQSTRLVESIQTRTYASVPAVGSTFELAAGQLPAQFQLDRQHAPALRAIAPGEQDFHAVHFRSMGVDPFERSDLAAWAREGDFSIRRETLKTCRTCHQSPGILSVNTYASFGQSAYWLKSSTPERETDASLNWKTRQFDWGLLQGLWQH